MTLVHAQRTMSALRYGAITCYGVAIVAFVTGLIVNQDELREMGLAVGIVGIAVDMRHYTARGINRLIEAMSLWQDDEPPLHRSDPGA